MLNRFPRTHPGFSIQQEPKVLQEAPTLLAPFIEAHHETHFIRQPANYEEVNQAIRAANVCFVNAIRYGGTSREIINPMASELCDHWINSLGQTMEKNSQIRAQREYALLSLWDLSEPVSRRIEFVLGSIFLYRLTFEISGA